MTPIVVDEVLWTDDAKPSFEKIIHWLYEKWTQKEVDKFLHRIEKMMITLQCYPESCRPSLKRKHVRICILNKHSQLIYYYNPKKKQIVVLLFWSMKDNPTKLKY